MVLQNSCSGATFQALIGILAGPGIGYQSAIARSHRRNEVTEDRSRCREMLFSFMLCSRISFLFHFATINHNMVALIYFHLF